MGSEAVCRARFKGQTSEGKALLETSEILFRGDFRLSIPFASVVSLRAEGGELAIGIDGDVAVFELGPRAALWAAKIRNPRGLVDKLGLKPDMSVRVLGVRDPNFLSQVEARAGAIYDSDTVTAVDLIFFAADQIDDLSLLSSLKVGIKSAGAIWVVSPKGKQAQVKDTDVMAAAREAGLVDNKVASFSATHTALKLVIPKTQR
jgi:Protein of unknown function (DUF3052)